jgi:hypothetical protein
LYRIAPFLAPSFKRDQADRHPGDQFFKYNDAEVTQVPASEVLQDRTGSDANPALLCYVRKGTHLVDTLYREGLEGMQTGEMQGGW